jgi:hypothetical protein
MKNSRPQRRRQPPQVLYRRQDDDERGRCLVAACTIPKGRLIFCERPLVALQSLGNPVLVCHHCRAFVGGPQTALHLVATRHRSTTTTEMIPCRYECGQVYCSAACEQDFWQDRHQYLCTGRIQEEDAVHHPLVEYKQHAVATNEIFLLVAEWMVALVGAGAGSRNQWSAETIVSRGGSILEPTLDGFNVVQCLLLPPPCPNGNGCGAENGPHHWCL